MPHVVLEPLPELSTPRLRLRAPVLEDAHALLAIYGDPEAMRYAGQDPSQGVAQLREKLTRDLDTQRRGESARWSVTLPGQLHAVGYLGFFQWSQRERRAELGYMLAKPYWGQGLMKEALPHVVRFGFGVMRLHRMEARVDPRNTASMRLLQGLGFRQEGLLRDSALSEGAYCDTAVLGLLESEWR
ncbi:GNAT family N-acetyltransferase [Aggregicoccus sp. 17bor-14]|uniref:GNAT family N-acetyltransferase n=1 Tax=Myxococcaceae TaxID=31 RepID=UPI00129C3DF2|nr:MULTISPECIES: GNAT family N-acetyltransferase [Myxococcaceae]MBF5045383.1 GNAT family N-acetyltransferase [Simulacricoccus sp. 17bor-14]MRI91125.1 GNAT family N-acetyltransferase [Aggregicoccus sp. 17bor-14]